MSVAAQAATQGSTSQQERKVGSKMPSIVCPTVRELSPALASSVSTESTRGIPLGLLDDSTLEPLTARRNAA
jgi:hypothetical protein